ncbi:MAG: aminotransferase class I/II-fold pyridoxal phosphate-dependent enzyme [Holophaga sp.]|nr:aminotransferase class I/II-fold pyridoxal phosphate-dependent enzyme [Holophaga sp.]
MVIHAEAQERNDRLQALNPAVLAALSPMGRRAFFPKGISFQAGQSQGCRINATIGQITDGAGNPLPLAALAEQLAGLNPRDAFLYSPVAGREPVRTAWHAKHVKEDPRMAAVALPVVTSGICHALSMGAELFFNPGDTLILPDLYWDNYEQIFQVGLEGEFLGFPFYDAGMAFNLEGLRRTLAGVRGKAQVLLNFPSNPNGYSPTPEEMTAIAEILVEAARDRPVVVYCDDAYHGLVFDPAATTKSLFCSARCSPRSSWPTPATKTSSDGCGCSWPPAARRSDWPWPGPPATGRCSPSTPAASACWSSAPAWMPKRSASSSSGRRAWAW